MRTPSERAVHTFLDRLDMGALEVVSPSGARRLFEAGNPGPVAEVRVQNPRAYRRIVTAGSMGLAEGYIAGEWDTPDLASVLELGIENIARRDTRIPSPLQPAQRLAHRLRPNSPRGAKRNIQYHYDLGNEFYRLWLDDSMTYSAACFDRGTEDLERAQVAKWDRILEILQPTPADHLLEIGCGWGGFALHAAERAGCRVTGISLSEEQTAFAREQARERDLDGLVDVRIQDYRSVRDKYDGVVSIEMFEAVGERWWPTFFSTVRDALRPGGRAALQVITIAEGRFAAYRRRADFIQKYIFPGGMLPSPSAFRSAAEAARVAVRQPRFFGTDYARTLASWLERFEGIVPDVRSLGFDDRFVRLWRYYLAYCMAGFRAGTVDVMQVGLEPRR